MLQTHHNLALVGNAGNFFQQNTRRDTRTFNHTNNQSHRGPRYPQYSITCIRLGTFQSWPTDIQQHPETLAESGFYYTGNDDHVRCFYCGIGLRNWDSEDNAFVEHARWSPECQYLKDKKGIDFINFVQDAIKRIQMDEALHNNVVTDTFNNDDLEADGNNRALDLLPNGDAPTRAEKNNPLLTDAAQSLMLMGYLPCAVKIAVDRVLKLNGWQGLSSRALMEELDSMERTGEIERDKLLTPLHRKLSSGLPDRDKIIHNSENFKRLEEESKDMKAQMMCKICCEMAVSIVFLPCGHLTSCAQCAPALKTCPVCRTEIKGSVKIEIA